MDRRKRINEYAKDIISKGLFKIGSIYPALRRPIDKIEIFEDALSKPFSTDGLNIYYSQIPSAEDLEHMMIHSVFKHLAVPRNVMPDYWNLACDISAEYLRTVFFPKGENKDSFSFLPEGIDPGNADAVYTSLTDMFEDELALLKGKYRRDDHRYWYTLSPALKNIFKREGLLLQKSEDENNRPFFKSSDSPIIKDKIEEILTERWYSDDEIAAGDVKTNRYGLAPGSREEKIIVRREGRYDFSKYLQRFSSEWEETKLDLGSFDYIPYYYGLQHYGNMPIIEPNEYRESNKIEDLVIAIDTSGSCSKETVERFLSEIENILIHREFFFDHMNVHIIQCDSKIESHVQIKSYEEWKKYCKDLSIKGRGGTDFTPVFNLVDKMIERRKLRKLKGLLYFTDGDGIYPEKKTPYETAFVFTTKAALAFPYPEWITPLCLDMKSAKVSKTVAAYFGENILERRKA